MNNYEKVHDLIETLDTKSKDYLKEYFKNAPEWLYNSIQIVSYPSNYTFIEQGSKINAVYILVKGIAKGTDYPILGAMYDFMWFDPIKSFGALEYFSRQQHYNATLITAAPSTMIVLPISIYNKWMQTDINAVYMDAATTTDQLLYEIRRERVYIFMQGTDRLSYFLMLYYKQFAKQETCPIQLTRQEISDCTGLSLRTVMRGLTSLLDQNCLIKSGNQLVINKEQYDNLTKMLNDIL